MYRRWFLAALAVALTSLPAPAAAAAAGKAPPAAAGWHARAIRDPLPSDSRATSARYPRGWSAGSVGPGSGYARAGGSRRVREIQQRLLRRGYRPGPRDGRFGPRTRAAVLWFQTKHGLPRNGRIDAHTLHTLRSRPQTATTAAAPRPARALTRAPTAATPAPTGDAWPALLAASVLLGLARRRADDSPAPTPAPVAAAVIGYIATAPGPQPARHAHTISTYCQQHHHHLTHLIHDNTPTHTRLDQRPALAHALEEIAAGNANGLILTHLEHLTHSASELAQLLHWITTTGAFLIALDYHLDTSTQAGQLAADALITIGNWERDWSSGNTQPHPTHAQTTLGSTHLPQPPDQPGPRVQRQAAVGAASARNWC